MVGVSRTATIGIESALREGGERFAAPAPEPEDVQSRTRKATRYWEFDFRRMIDAEKVKPAGQSVNLQEGSTPITGFIDSVCRFARDVKEEKSPNAQIKWDSSSNSTGSPEGISNLGPSPEMTIRQAKEQVKPPASS